MKKSFIRRLRGFDYNNIEDVPKGWRGNKFSNLKQQNESWLYDVMFKQRLTGNKLDQAGYWYEVHKE